MQGKPEIRSINTGAVRPTHHYLKMFVRLGLVMLAASLMAVLARPEGLKRMKKDAARKDIAIRSKSLSFERGTQGNFCITKEVIFLILIDVFTIFF